MSHTAAKPAPKPAAPAPAEKFGIVAEFADPTALVRAAEGVRRAGYRVFDTHSPFPIHGIERAMGLRRSGIPWVVLCGGLIGGSGAYTMQWWMHAVDYKLVISGKPFHSVPAFIPVTFELTVLLSAFAAVGGILVFNLLPMLYHPLLKHPRFARATSDGFFLSIEARDPLFNAASTTQLLESLGGSHIEVLES